MVDLPRARRLLTDTTIMDMMTATNMVTLDTVMDMVIMAVVVVVLLLIMRLLGRMGPLEEPRDLLADHLPWITEDMDILRVGMGVAAAAPAVVGGLPLLDGVE